MTHPAHLAPGKSAEADNLIIQRRHRLVVSLAPPRGRSLLDVGCGNGAQTLLFIPSFEETIGLDISGSALDEFAKTTADSGIGSHFTPLVYDGFLFPMDDASVDYIISFEVLEHVADEELTLKEMARVMKPGAILAMSVPNRWWIFETHGAELPLLPWNRVPFFSWLPKSIHDRWARARIYRRRKIESKIAAAGLTIQTSCYITAPMDVVKAPWLRDFLRATIFRGDRTPFPFFSTAILVIAEKAGADR